MDETSKSKRRSKLQKRKENENKLKSEECTPVKHLVPQAQSTPLSCKVVNASPTEDGIQIISDDEEEEMHYAFRFQCTQDTLDVDWDDSPKKKPSKILGSKVKRKLSKGESFSQKKKNLKACSPVQPLRSRRRFIIEKPNNDFSKLIRDLQAIAKQCGNLKDETSGTSEDNSCEKDNSSSKGNENLEAKIQEQGEHSSIECRGTEDRKGRRAVVNEKHNSSNIQVPSQHPLPRPELEFEEKSKNNKINETFTALFDDDDDECMVQCSQEIENKLNSNIPVRDNCDNDFPSVGRNELSSVEYKNKNLELENSTKSSQSHITGPPKSPKSRIKRYVRNKSGQLSKCRTNSCPCSKTSTHTCYNDVNSDVAKTNFKSAITSEVFDDSFDAVIQNFTEEDIIMLSQGVALEKEERNDLNSDRKPQNYQLSEIVHKMNLKKEPVINSSLPKTSNVCKLPTNSTLHHISSNKQVNVSTNLNRLRASNNSKVQLQVRAPTSVNSTRLPNQPKSIESVQFSSRDRTVVNSVPLITRPGQNNTATRTGNSANTLTTQSSNVNLQSSPQKCTPEEIQKKRLEAKMKLERKKLAMSFQRNKQQHRLKDDATTCIALFESESEKTRLVNSVKLMASRVCESKVSSGIVCSASVIEEKRQYAKLKLSRKKYLDELSCSPNNVTSSQENESTTCMGLFQNESQSVSEKTRLLDGVKVKTSYICESKIPSDVCNPSVIEAKRQYAKLKLAQKRYLDGLSCSPNSATSSQESK